MNMMNLLQIIIVTNKSSVGVMTRLVFDSRQKQDIVILVWFVSVSIDWCVSARACVCVCVAFLLHPVRPRCAACSLSMVLVIKADREF